MARPIGFMAVNPLWARASLTGLLRGAVAIALAMPAIPLLASQPATGTLSALTLLLLAGKEAVTGAVIGFLLGVPLWSFEFAGDLLDQQRGATSGRLNHPAGFEDVSITGTLLAITGATLFVVSGGLQMLAALLYASWSVWPVLSPLPAPTPQAPALILRLLEDVARQGVLLAIPLVLAMLASDLALMLIARFAPQFRVEDASSAARNLVFCIVLPLYCVFLVTYMRQDLLIPPGFLSGLQRGFQ